MRLHPSNRPFSFPLGARGETAAWAHLIQKGYQLLEKNYRCRFGEIDVIAKKSGRICFLEIKTRTSHRFGRPEESVHGAKQRKIRKTALCYLKETGQLESPVSFEVLAVDWPKEKSPSFRLIEQAFTFEESDFRDHAL